MRTSCVTLILKCSLNYRGPIMLVSQLGEDHLLLQQTYQLDVGFYILIHTALRLVSLCQTTLLCLRPRFNVDN